MTLREGRSYQIDLKGANTGSGTLNDPYLRGVYDPDGSLLPGTTDDDSGAGWNSRVTFTAQQAGTHYVAAGGDSGWLGTYQLMVQDLTDDFDAGTNTQGTVAVGGSKTGYLEAEDDQDWFAVDLKAGGIYRIDLEGQWTDAGSLFDPYLYGVYDANGVLLPGTTVNDGGATYNSRVTFTAESDGTHYVAAGSFDGEWTGTYKVSVRKLRDDFMDNTGTGGTVEFGSSVTGEIETPNDRDWFAVELDVGRTYRIDLKADSTHDGTLRNPVLYGIHDADGTFIPGTFDVSSGIGHYNSRVDFTPIESGTYYISAGSDTDYEVGTGTYTLAVSDAADWDDFTADTGTSGTVEVGGFARGELEDVGDRDWFAVTLEADTPYMIHLEGWMSGRGTVTSTDLYGIYDTDGNLIDGTTNVHGGNGGAHNSRVFFTPEEAGTYYVEAGAKGDRQGTYRLSVTDVTGVDGIPDDFEAGTGTTGAVEVGGSVRGDIQFRGDRDWFAVELEAGKAYQIDLMGQDTRSGTLYTTYLRGIYDADGTYIPGTTHVSGWNGSQNSRVYFNVEDTGTYYVAAGGLGIYEGTYRLSVGEIVDKLTATTQTIGAVEVGDSARGNLDYPGDRDWFAVTLDAGKPYRIDLEGKPNGVGTLNDPHLKGIYDADGTFIPGTWDADSGAGNNSRLTFIPPKAGTYYVSASAWRDVRPVGYGYTNTYKLSVTEIVDDFTAATDTTGAVAVGGSATGEIELPGDRDWFAVELEAGKGYQIDLERSQTGAFALSDPRLYGIHYASGRFIFGTTNDNDGAGKNSRVFFTPWANTTYYVSAGAYQDLEGTYKLSVTEIADDFTRAIDTTGAVAAGGSATGEIDFSRDRDWFAVELDAGSTYRIDLKGDATGAGTLDDPLLRGIHDAEGVLIPGTKNDNGGAGNNSRVFFTPTTDGTYYVAAGTHENMKGTYTLSVTEITDDFTAGTGTTGTVTVGGSATGEIDLPGDRDWFAVELGAGKGYRIDLEGKPNGVGTLVDPRLYGIHDADGVLIPGTENNDGGKGNNSRVFFTPTTDGTYYVSAGAIEDFIGTYRLSVVEGTDDFMGGTGTSGLVAVGGSATGEMDLSGDRDWFAVELDAGSTYRIDLEGSETGAGTLVDPRLYGIHDADGVLIPGTKNDDGGKGNNSRVFFTPTTDGTYYVAAGARGPGHGTYTLSVTEIADDFTAATDTTGAVAVGGSATGEIDLPGDRDWFAVELGAGKAYRIDLKGSETGVGTLSDPYLQGIYDANGTFIPGTENNDGGEGLNSRLTFTPEEAGTYYVAAGAWGPGEGTYTLSVTEIADDFVAGTGTTGTVTVGGSASGAIDFSGDKDWFAVTLKASGVYRIDLEGDATGAGTLSDPYLHGIYDANGTFIPGTENNDGGTDLNSRVLFTPTSDGTYYVAARSANSGHLGTYTLSVRLFDDFTATTQTSGAVAVGGSASGAIDFSGDKDWFAVTLKASGVYRIDLEGDATGAGTLSDPYLHGIYDANGTFIPGTENDDGGTDLNSRLTFTADEAETYYVAAGAYQDFEGTYTLSVEEVL